MSGAGSFLSGIGKGYFTGSALQELKADRQERNSSKTDQSPTAWGRTPIERGVTTATIGSDGGFDPASFDQDFVQGIYDTAAALKVDPEDVATFVSFETAGTFDPVKLGPTTQWGQHQGLIQFGKPQAAKYGVDFSSRDTAARSQLGSDGAIVRYALDHGFKPGEHNGLDLYSTINAGAPGRYRASDANNGGTAGSVRDKYETQMHGHREKARSLLQHFAPEAQKRQGPEGRGVTGALNLGEMVVNRFFKNGKEE